MVPTEPSSHASISTTVSRRGWPLSAAAIASAWLAVGVAAWLLPATIHVVTWGAGGAAGRVALFAPAYQLRWTLGAALLLAAATWLAGDRTPEARARRAWALAPLSSLWVWAVPFLPWVPDRLPLLLVFAGPLRLVVAGCAVLAIGYRLWKAADLRVRPWNAPGRRAACVIALALYASAGYRSVHQLGLGGDEPHYLVLTQSVLLDHDIQIENNHTRGDYRQFYGGPLAPDYLMRGTNGAIYSIHAPGLPVLLAPAFAVAGSLGAVLTMGLLGALAAVAVFDMAVLVGGATAAWPAWAAVCLTVPFVPHAWAIFPEMAGAAIVAWGLLWAMRADEASPAAWAWRGVCLAALPWLHTKFSVFLGVLALALVVRAWPRVSRMLALSVPIGLSLVGWAAFFVLIYGTIDPQAPYGAYTAQFVRFGNLPRSLLGAFFDQKFGLLVYAPIYVVSVWGTWLLWREPSWRWTAVLTVALAGVFTLSSARLYMWWGGASAPARFLVPVVPLLTPSLAIVFARLRRGMLAVHVWLALWVSLGITALSLTQWTPPLLFSSPHGVARLAELLRAGSPLVSALPTFTEENWTTPAVRLALWFAVLAITALVAMWAGRRAARRPGASVFWPMFAELVVLVTVASAVVGPYGAEARAETVRNGRFGLLTRFDPDARRAFDYRGRTLSKMSPEQWVEASSLSFRFDPAEAPDGQGRLTEGLSLPPGTYQVTALFDDSVPRNGDLLASLGGGNVLARAEGPLPRLTTMRVAMPIAVPRVWIQMSDAPSAAAARRVDITPLSVVPERARVQADVRRVESVPGRPDAYMAYVDEGAFPEGGVFWTRGTSQTQVLVSTVGAPFLKLTLHVGPKGGAVRLRVDGRDSQVTLGPEETRTVFVPVPAGTLVVPVQVQSTTGFRPADVVPGATDMRDLGCQVRVELSDEGA